MQRIGLRQRADLGLVLPSACISAAAEVRVPVAEQVVLAMSPGASMTVSDHVKHMLRVHVCRLCVIASRSMV